MEIRKIVALSALTLFASASSDLASAQKNAPRIADAETASAQISGAPIAKAAYPQTVFWGDTHVHTALSSLDASDSGRFGLGPEDAYRFARGEPVKTNTGAIAQLERPLDFLVVTDHAEFMGLWEAIKSGDKAIMATDWGRRWRAQYLKRKEASDSDALDNEMLDAATPLEKRQSPPLRDKGFIASVWDKIGTTADAYNEPGKFTAFIGFEWSSTPNWSNLHRNVIFKEDSRTTNKVLPFAATDSVNPEDLWAYLANYEKSTGGEVLAVPHNANLSNGLMFSARKMDGKPFDVAYAEQRGRWEPLYEVTQMKGDSETHPILAPNDEFADYETWLSFAGKRGPDKWSAEDVERLKGSYARSALQRGLDIHAKLGINPFKFGMIGSTDSHNALATADENNYWGKFYKNAPSPQRILQPGLAAYKMKSPWNTWELAASGYAAAWATENTRESIFAAMKRREVYASTGPRIELRFFGGWDYKRAESKSPDYVRIGYSKGVPMGGDLTSAPAGKVPTFLIRAVKDPTGANLDRVQVVKGWRSADGALHEKIYNVALSGKRKAGKKGKVEPLVSTVNLADASYANTIGAPELSVVWKDPDFKKDQLAFYYVRVLEIPTPRWTAYDVAKFNLKDVPDNIPMVTQERAYSSPIWYTPTK